MVRISTILVIGFIGVIITLLFITSHVVRSDVRLSAATTSDVVFLRGAIIQSSNGNSGNNINNGAIDPKIDLLPSMQWTDGCRYLFLDVGANIGMHERFLWESENYADNMYSETIFDRIFPVNRKNRSDVCAIGIEANMAHKPRLAAMQRYLTKLNYKVHYILGAASNESKTLTFYHQNDVKCNEWGFADGVSSKQTKDHPVQVQAFSLPLFIEHYIKNRVIPDKIYESDPSPAVIMKMDIEGAEFEVLPALLASGSWCSLHTITLEFHPRSIPGIDEAEREKIKKQTFESSALFHQFSSCPTTISDLDSERYFNDTESGKRALLPFFTTGM